MLDWGCVNKELRTKTSALSRQLCNSFTELGSVSQFIGCVTCVGSSYLWWSQKINNGQLCLNTLAFPLLVQKTSYSYGGSKLIAVMTKYNIIPGQKYCHPSTAVTAIRTIHSKYCGQGINEYHNQKFDSATPGV